MKTSKQAQHAAKQLFRSCVVNGILDEDRVRRVVQQLIQKQPRGFRPILAHFHRLVRLDLERRNARVESAVPLSPALQAAVQANLARLYGAGLTISFHTNPGLIGGMRIQVGSDVFDGSVSARLTELVEQF